MKSNYPPIYLGAAREELTFGAGSTVIPKPPRCTGNSNSFPLLVVRKLREEFAGHVGEIPIRVDMYVYIGNRVQRSYEVVTTTCLIVQAEGAYTNREWLFAGKLDHLIFVGACQHEW